MNRREFNGLQLGMLVLGCVVPWQGVEAVTLADLSKSDAAKALKIALEKGALSAVSLLGTADGYLGNEKVRIPLPSYLDRAADVMRTFGLGAKVDELVTAMNRGAEAAVPLAKDMLVRAAQSMTVTDAKGILSGGDTAVTEFFAGKTRADLAAKFLPLVVKATEKVGLADKYNQLAGRAAELGLVKSEDANIQKYVTAKALDGLYFMIAEEEKKIRENPVAYGSAILSKVFGALKL